MAAPDLISLSLAQANLSESLPPVQTALPFVITAATRACERFAGRIFAPMNYDEMLVPCGGRFDRGEPATANLAYFPVNSVASVMGGRTTALTIVNTATTANQIARVAFTFTGDVELPDLVYTGLNLTTIASGTQTISNITWTTASPFTTVDSVTSQINALGNGWTCTLTNNLSGWPAAELIGAKSVKPGFSPGTCLDLFSLDMPNSSVDFKTGIVSITYGPTLGNFGFGYWQNDFDALGDYDGSPGTQQIRVRYNAGWVTPPFDVQQACLIIVKSYLQELQTVTTFEDEKFDEWRGKLSDISEKEIPYSAQQILTRYKASWL